MQERVDWLIKHLSEHECLHDLESMRCGESIIHRSRLSEALVYAIHTQS